MPKPIEVPAYFCCGVFGYAIPWQKWLERKPIAVRVINHTVGNSALREFLRDHCYVYIYSRAGQLQDDEARVAVAAVTEGDASILPIIAAVDFDRYLTLDPMQRRIVVDWDGLELAILNQVALSLRELPLDAFAKSKEDKPKRRKK